MNEYVTLNIINGDDIKIPFKNIQYIGWDERKYYKNGVLKSGKYINNFIIEFFVDENIKYIDININNENDILDKIKKYSDISEIEINNNKFLPYWKEDRNNPNCNLNQKVSNNNGIIRLEIGW